MTNYLVTKFKDKYRILPEIDANTNDFCRDCHGDIDEDMVYIACSYDNKIYYYGLNDSHRAILGAYIPSLGRGRNIKKALEKEGIAVLNYDESSDEVTFNFLASDIDKVAPLMKAKTSGASISPWSKRNLPKSDVEIPKEKIEEYKKFSSNIQKNDVLLIKSINNDFLTNILEKSLRKKDKKYSYKQDMKQLKMSRQVKEFIYVKGFWKEYIEYLDAEIEKYYNNK